MPNMSAELYEYLREMRRAIAERDGIMQYQVFLDRALQEMAENRPRDREEFLRIWGTSAPMAERYVDEFLDAIRQYCEERNIISNKQTFGDQNMKHPKLYDLLLEKNRELAKKEGGGIFTHRTLREMSSLLPQTEAEFRQIHGIGPVKTERYADIFLKIIKDYCEKQGHPPAISVAKGQQYADPSEYAPRLYELLKDERNRIAAEEKVDAFQVFWDRTLKQMAIYLPQTEEEFLEIDRIGPWKTERYANRFLPIIREFCRENGISYDRVEPSLQELLEWLRR